jgi:hypothetical protein
VRRAPPERPALAHDARAQLQAAASEAFAGGACGRSRGSRSRGSAHRLPASSTLVRITACAPSKTMVSCGSHSAVRAVADFYARCTLARESGRPERYHLPAPGVVSSACAPAPTSTPICSSVAAGNAGGRMQHDGVAHGLAFRVERLLHAQRPAMRARCVRSPGRPGRGSPRRTKRRGEGRRAGGGLAACHAEASGATVGLRGMPIDHTDSLPAHQRGQRDSQHAVLFHVARPCPRA